jgi:hypothetical protein
MKQLATSLLLATLAACDASPDAAGAGDARIVLQPSHVRVLDRADAIATVLDLDVRPDGAVWVLNSAEPLFVGFDPDGRLIDAYGRRGGGPDELGAPAGFVAGGMDGEPWVFDSERHMLVAVSGADGPRREHRLPADEVPPGSLLPGIRLGWSNVVRTARLGDELILPRRSRPPAGGVSSLWLSAWTADLVALNPATGSVRTLVALGDALGDPTPHFDLTDAFLPFPLWYRLWAACPDGIRVYDRLGNQVRRFTAAGVERDAIPLPHVRTEPVTAGQYARALFPLAVIEAAPAVPESGRIDVSPADSAMIMDGLTSRVNAPPEQLANLLPRYLDLRCDDDGTLWLQPFDIDDGGLEGGAVWLRISAAGDVTEVRMPDRFDPYRFTGGRIWGVQRDEFDVAAVAWIAAPGAR